MSTTTAIGRTTRLGTTRERLRIIELLRPRPRLRSRNRPPVTSASGAGADRCRIGCFAIIPARTGRKGQPMRRPITAVPLLPTVPAMAILATTVVSGPAWTTPAGAQERTLTVADLYDPGGRIDVGGSAARGAWIDDAHYVERTAPGGAGSPLARVNALSGTREALYDTAAFEAAIASLPGLTDDDARDIARRANHVMNGTRTALVFSFADDLYHYRLETSDVRRLTRTPETEIEVSFSPDGTLVAFVRDGNLNVVDIDGQREVPLTTDGSERVRNGELDWVYQEEIYGRGNFRGYWWSPDSSRLAYLQLDDRDVPIFTVLDHIPYRPEVEEWEYPKAGDTNPTVRLGMVRVAGGATTWADLARYATDDPLIVEVGWTPDSSRVVFQIQNREQTWLDLDLAHPLDGSVQRILRETSEAWVNVTGAPRWLDDGTFLWRSERTGWAHLYHLDRDGKVLSTVTGGEWEVRAVHGVDETAGIVYFSGTERSPIGLDVYRVGLDGTGLRRLSEAPGTHSAAFSPGFTHYLDTWSDINTPPQVRLHAAADGAELRVVAAREARALRDYALPAPEFVQVENRDGFAMEGLLIKPPDFDASRQYPVYQHIYGGPHVQRVRNAWSRETLWWQLLAQRGIVVWVLDNQTASGKGAVSAWPVYERFGELELKDQEDGLDWLIAQGFVDRERVGIEGWSYGGFMVSYALTHSDRWAMGIAGGSVTDWRDYDTIYTERYMRMPQHNPEGYQRSSPRFKADSLSGALLLVHGSMDENVHMQNTLQFAHALQQANKPFEMMIYPRSRHRLGGADLEHHRRELMLDFVLEHLRPGHAGAASR
ncbi:MAG: S9 family peptidase [Acidobacteria bacterium]|nr:S9 family peptidase [Acidobacteriota bacterium]